MASRFDRLRQSIFRPQGGGGLLGQLTPEEERALLFEQQMLAEMGPPPVEPEQPFVDPLAPLPEEPVATKPLVIEAEPEREQEPPAEEPKPEAKKPLVEDVAPEEKPSLVVATEPRPPAVVDEQMTAVQNWVVEASVRRKAELAEQAARTTNVEVAPDQAVYTKYLEEAINSEALFKSTPKEFKELASSLADDVFGSNAKPTVEDKQWEDLAFYRARNPKAGPTTVTSEGLATAKDQDAPPTFVESAIAGGATTTQLVWAGAEAVAEVAGADSLAAKAGKNREYYQGLREVLPQGVKLSDIASVGDALQWAQQTVGEQGVLMAAPISGAVTGRIIAGSVGAKLGAFGPSWMLGVGEIQSSNKDINPDQKAGLSTLIGGTAVAALDTILPERVGSALVKSLGKEQAEEVAKRMLLMPASERMLAVAGRVGKEGSKGAGIEALTEGTQTAIAELAAAIETGTEIQPGVLNRILESAATGGFMGGAVGGTVGGVTEGAQQRQAVTAPIQEMRDAQWAVPVDQVAARLSQPTQAAPLAPAPQTPFERLSTSKVVVPARPVVIAPDERPERPVVVSATPLPVDPAGRAQDFQVPKGKVTSRFGPRQTFTTANGAQASSNHAGVDIALPSGAPIPAGADGVVVFAGKRGGYGNYIVVQHSDGTTSAYAHASKIGVSVGDHVAQGETIGRVGSTGNATGPHLHLERRDRQGRTVNPLDGSVVTTTDQDGAKDDSTPWDVADEELEVPEFVEPEEMDAAYEAATGQRFETAPETEVSEATPFARNEEVIPEPIRNSPVPSPEVTGAVVERSLEEAKASNPARAALAAIETEGRDWTQPMPGEEPVFASAEHGAEVVGFTSTDGTVRRIGEPPVTSQEVAQPEVIAPPPAEAGVPLEFMPEVSPDVLPEAPVATATPENLVSTVEPTLATTPELLESSTAIPEAVASTDAMRANVRRAVQSAAAKFTEAQAEAAATPMEKVRSKISKKRAAEIEKRVDEIDDKLFDLETEGEKSAVKRYMQKLVREGVLAPTEVDALAYMFKDRDMGAEDIVSEIRTSVGMWAEEQLGAKPAALARVTTPAAPAASERARIVYEVGPDPSDKSLDNRWQALDLPTKQSITDKVNAEVLPEVFKMLRAKADIVGQIGGFMGASNPSVALSTVTHTKAFEMARALGYALEQHSMIVISEREIPGTSPTDAIRVSLGKANPAEVYDKLWKIKVDGAHPIGGYMMNGTEMLILNFSDTPTDQLAVLIDNATDGQYDVSVETAHAAFVERGDDNYGYRGKSRAGSERAVVDRLRSRAVALREAGISEAEGKAEQVDDDQATPPKPAAERPARVEAERPDGRRVAPAPAEPAKPEPVAEVGPALPSAPKESRATQPAKHQKRTPEEARAERNAFREDVRKQVATVLRAMQLEGRNDLTVEVVDFFDQPNVMGAYERDDLRIRIAAFVADDVAQTARHEIIHWARDTRVFTGEEWSVLANWAKNDPKLMAWAKSAYPNENLESQIEEAVAEGFARWNGGSLEPSGAIQKILAKLREVINAIREAFGAAGVTRGQINEAADLLRALETGAQIRKADERRSKIKVTRPEFGRRPWKDDLSRELLAGNIKPEEHHALRQNPSEKFQSGWHGSPATDIDRFSLDFIGQGEGAQAFGWGLYFAQKKEIAEWYRKKLTMGTKDPVDVAIEVDGTSLRAWVAIQLGTEYQLAGYEAADRIFDFLSTNKPYNGFLETLHVAFDNDMSEYIVEASKADNQGEVSQLIAEQGRVGQIFRALSNRRVAMKEYPAGGKLYKVEVPEDEDLLDLDRPMGQQPAKIKKALEAVAADLQKWGLLANHENTEGEFSSWSGAHLQFVLKSAFYSDQIPMEGISEEAESAWVNGNGAMATSIYLRDNGIVGLRYLDRDSRTGLADGETRNFVIFDDSHIELKAKYRVVDVQMAATPLSDPSIPNPSIWRRIHNQTMGMLGAIAGKDVDTTDNLVDAFKRKITQRYQQVIKTQKRAEEQLGVGRMPSGQNPMEMITADERGYKLQLLIDNMIRPMATEMSQRGVSMDDLGLFLYARHAPARNARIAKINPEFRKPGNPGSGMEDAEAANIMAAFASSGKIDDLQMVARHIDAMIAYAQQERIAAGLLTPEAILNGFGPGDFYVPLRGNESIEPELEMDFTMAARKGGGFSVAGKEGHRMFGRETKANLEEIVGYTITQAQEAIDRAYRNRVGQSMLAMFRSVPDPAFVQIDRVKRVAVWNEKKGQVEYQMQTRMTDPTEQQRTIFVKEDGEVTKMTFNDQNPSAMRFVKGAKNLGMTELSRVLQLMSVFTRLWSKSNTQWNIDFILANATKDIQTGVLNASTLNQKGLRRAMIKNLVSLKPLMGAWMGSRANAGAGFGSGNVWFETFAEFEANGGKLNYGQIEPLEDAIKSARREIRNASRSPVNPVKLAGDLLMWIDHTNSAFENMTRLAAYKALRDGGIPAKQAAEAVRELTTNFQQHGEWGPKFNAAYGFANASVIGGARFLKTVATNPAILAGLIGLGMLEDFLNAAFDDDEWDRYTEEDKHGNFIVLMPASFGFDIKLPAGYGLNAFITTGRKFSELWRGKKNKDGTTMSVLDAAADMGMGFINAFAPITGSTFFNVVTPTIADPIVNIYQNQNNWGRPIMPTQPFRKEQQKPDSQLAFDKTSQFWKTLATAMNAVGGGNEIIPGWTPMDISPESYKHVTEETVGGLGRTFMRTLGLAEKVAKGEEVGPNDIPVVRRFAGSPYGAANAKGEQVSAFYERLGEARVVLAQAKEMMARHGKESEEYQEFRAGNQPIIEFADKVKEAETRLRAYNTAENAAERGAERAVGLKRRDRKAIFKATKVVVPAGRKLTAEEVAKVKSKTQEKKERLAEEFNVLYLKRVMGED